MSGLVRQGLAFWMGHRQALYRGYPLSEGALVAEASNLIFANLPPEERLLCEVQYSHLALPDSWTTARGEIRADLVVASRIDGALKKNPGYLLR